MRLVSLFVIGCLQRYSLHVSYVDIFRTICSVLTPFMAFQCAGDFEMGKMGVAIGRFHNCDTVTVTLNVTLFLFNTISKAYFQITVYHVSFRSVELSDH